MVSAQSNERLDNLKNELIAGCDQLNVALSEQQISQLLDYITLFDKWNRAYNLSAVRNINDMLSRHLLDSLSVAPHCEAECWLDVGTGGGLPGIPLAICFPEKHFTLLDSNGKKTRFLFQVKTELGLTNVDVVQSRVESYKPEHRFDAIISRAFASLSDMIEGCHHLLAPKGMLFAMKGQYPTEELSEISRPHRIVKEAALAVPRTIGERHLVVIELLSA